MEDGTLLPSTGQPTLYVSLTNFPKHIMTSWTDWIIFCTDAFKQYLEES